MERDTDLHRETATGTQGDSDRDTGRQGHRETGTQGDRDTGTQGDSARHLAWSEAGTGRQREGHRETGTQAALPRHRETGKVR